MVMVVLEPSWLPSKTDLEMRFDALNVEFWPGPCRTLTELNTKSQSHVQHKLIVQGPVSPGIGMFQLDVTTHFY